MKTPGTLFSVAGRRVWDWGSAQARTITCALFASLPCRFALLCAGVLPALLSLVVFQSCRIEKRLVEVSIRESRSSRFRFDGASEGFESQAVRWSSSTRVGSAAALITPAEPGALAGYGGLGRRLFPPRLYPGNDPTVFCRPYNDVESEPRLKVLAFEGSVAAQGFDEGDAQKARRLYLLLSFDLVAVTQDVTQALLDEANELMVQRGYPSLGHANFQVTATHTHSGPAGLALSPLWSAFACDSFRAAYRKQVIVAARQLMGQAIDSLRPASSLQIHHAQVSGLNTSRFKGMGVDEHTFALLARDASDDVLGCALSYPVHSTFYGPNSLRLSRDVAGWIENAMTGNVAVPEGAPGCFFLNGAGGNAKARLQDRSGEDYAKLVVSRFINAAEPKIASTNAPLAFEDDGPAEFSYAAVSYELPKAVFNFSACGLGAARPFVSLPILNDLPRVTMLAALKVGEDLVLFVPGELVFESSRALAEIVAEMLGPQTRLSFVTTANDYSGYIVPSSRYSSEELESCSSLFGKGHLGALEAALRRLLQAWS